MSITLQNVSNIQFRVETLVAKDKRKRVRKDADGYYMDIPVAVLGTVSQNQTYYDVGAFAEQMTSPKTYINKVLTQGKLYGEWGHPKILGMSNQEAIDRLSYVDEEKHSHHFKSITTGETLSDGGKLVLATLKPTGPYKQSLIDNLEDPVMNTSFSLRAITSAEQKGNVSYRVMRKLVTFDAVGAGGYAEAAKSFSPALESFDVTITPTGQITLTQVSMESYTDTELNELFGTNDISKQKRIVTVLSPDASIEFKSSLGVRSFYMDLIRE